MQHRLLPRALFTATLLAPLAHANLQLTSAPVLPASIQPSPPAIQAATAAQAGAVRPGPFRLHAAWDLPEWLELRIEQRARYETFDQDFRAGQSGDNQQLALRTSIFAAANFAPWRVTAELLDSRAYYTPDDAQLDTTMVNAVELLQAHLDRRFDGVFSEGDRLDLLLGRYTMNLGNRRLIARNQFRNTINAFTGLDATWHSTDSDSVHAFYVLPVRRLPMDQDALEDNSIQFDQEQEETRFFGLDTSHGFGDSGIQGQLYALRLDESDEAGINTRNRRLWTVGARVDKAPKANEVHFEWESAYQFGKSRSSTSATNTTDLDHSAELHHLTVGYRFEGELEPTLEGLFDYASGDRNPNDGDYNRFDTLFGARRFEFGPTGILGAFARANILSPGLRLFLLPTPAIRFMLTHRAYWLASNQDAWTTSGLVDPAGQSGSFLGQMTEFSVRYDLVPKNLQLELGVAHLFAGEFIDQAPNATDQGDLTYVYLQTTVTL